MIALASALSAAFIARRTNKSMGGEIVPLIGTTTVLPFPMLASRASAGRAKIAKLKITKSRRKSILMKRKQIFCLSLASLSVTNEQKFGVRWQAHRHRLAPEPDVRTTFCHK